eukprot:scaffold15289_cov248-Alexandrium_tamarense.AAC.6
MQVQVSSEPSSISHRLVDRQGLLFTTGSSAVHLRLQCKTYYHRVHRDVGGANINIASDLSRQPTHKHHQCTAALHASSVQRASSHCNGNNTPFALLLRSFCRSLDRQPVVRGGG